MDEAAATRRAALDAVSDVEPAGLRDRIDRQLDSESMVPGVVTILTARARTGGGGVPLTNTDGTLSAPLARRAAGVQLIYDGLRLTRTLAQEEPWTDPSQDDTHSLEPDMAILVADVLVARGFYLLACTEAADRAVETVRTFGRDQTVRRQTDEPALDRNLEADVLELAIVGGATVEGSVSPGLRELAAELAETVGSSGFGPAESFLPENVEERLSAALTESPSSGGVTTSVDD